MFNRFIIATDLSPASFQVVNCISGLRALGAKQGLLLLCLGLQEVTSQALTYTTAFLEANLKEQKKLLEEQGFVVQTRIVPGFPKQEINRIALEENYSLIVVGSRGHSLVGEAILGGVAYAVIHSARKPVLVVPIKTKEIKGKKIEEFAQCDFTKHILFPTDFSENANQAFGYLEKLVASEAKQVTLVHIQDKTRINPYLSYRLSEFNQIDQARLENLKKALQKKSKVKVNLEIGFGNPSVEIIKLIKKRGVQMVVMGSQGRGFVEELFLGSVSHNVVRSSIAPVLLIPAKR